MPPRVLEVPVVLRRAWGEEVAEALAAWVGNVLEERAVSRDEHRQILSRLDILEREVADLKADVQELRREMNERFDRMLGWTDERFDRMLGWTDERFDRVSVRFDQVNARFDQVNARFDQMHERMDRMYHQMVVQTRWLIGALALIGIVVSVLLAVAQFAR